MIFITGGRAQGKTETAVRLYERTEFSGTDRSGEKTAVADGRTDDLALAMKAEIVIHLECFVRRIMQEGGDPGKFAERLTAENPAAIVAADEIGCGIVPADEFERAYRECEGRICQQIAEFSREVYRVVCGIPVRIK